MRVNQDVSTLQVQISSGAGARSADRVAAAEKIGRLEEAAIARDTEMARMRAQLEEKEEALAAGTAAAVRAVQVRLYITPPPGPLPLPHPPCRGCAGRAFAEPYIDPDLAPIQSISLI